MSLAMSVMRLICKMTSLSVHINAAVQLSSGYAPSSRSGPQLRCHARSLNPRCLDTGAA